MAYTANPATNAVTWWGNGSSVDSTGQQLATQYCVTNLIRILQNYGGDPSSVFLTGFSRGAIADGYIGLSTDEIADIWVGFLPHSHYDGYLFTSDSGNIRTSRIKGRASFITYGQTNLDSGANGSIYGINNLTSLGFPVEAYQILGIGHTDQWITDQSAPVAGIGNNLASIPDVRARMRAWIQGVITNKTGTHCVSGKVVDSAGMPIKGARVQSGASHWTFTDASGQYSLAGLVNGSRSLIVSYPPNVGFATNNVSIQINGANLTNKNFFGTAIKISSTVRNSGGDLIINFVGPANATFGVLKATNFAVSPFPTAITTKNTSVITGDSGNASGVGQAIINAADLGGAVGYFKIVLSQ